MTGEVPKEGRLCQLTYVVLCSVFWVSWHLKRGPLGCLEMSVWNYHCTLCNISEELYVALHGLVQGNLVYCGLVLHTRILRQLHICNHQIQGQNLVLHSSKYGKCVLMSEQTSITRCKNTRNWVSYFEPWSTVFCFFWFFIPQAHAGVR